MAKGRKLTDDIKLRIVDIYRDMHKKDPKVRAKEVQVAVVKALCRANPKADLDWPGLSVVQKIITEVNKKERESPPDSQDAPWSMGSLEKYPLPYEAIPRVFEVAGCCANQSIPFSIREAIWTSRLSPFIENNQTLLKTATTYARAQANSTLVGLPFDSRGFDKELHSPGNQPPARATEGER